jgi:deoxyribodipyrimidine photo-lyase
MAIFLFHRDLRLFDNIGFIKCATASNQIYPTFIFTPDQIDRKKNKYFSDSAVQFMYESLVDLNKELNGKLNCFYGDTIDILTKLISDSDIKAIYENADFTPYAKQRQNQIAKLCEKHKIEYNLCQDITLLPMGSIKTGSDTFYKVFTPFYKSAIKLPEPPQVRSGSKSKFKIKTFKNRKTISDFKNIFKSKNILQNGGRKEGLKALNKSVNIKNYDKTRDCPLDKTTELSAHLHFGTLSVREVYHFWKKKLAKGSKELLKQLWWREFYIYQINYNPPDYKKQNKVKWSKNQGDLQRWKDGTTGCPIVDAGMRQLNETGWMHNRLRMVVAMYLIFYLKQDWREGEKYFAQKLVDISRSQNEGNWLWVSGLMSYSNPYFRAFSMDSQMKRFDPKAEYIKKWAPEYSVATPNELANWESYYKKYNFPKPIIADRKDGIKMIKSALS